MRKSLSALTLSASTFVALLAGEARPQCTLVKLQEPASNADDQFGVSVAMDGDTVAIGEIGIDHAGAVHVFVRNGLEWTHVQELVSPDAAPDQHFGKALALQGGRLLVGAPEPHELTGPGPGPGTAYLFVRQGQDTPSNPPDEPFVLEATLLPQSVPSPGLFGWDVALAGDVALVGAPGTYTSQSSPLSAVFVFAHADAWFEQARLDPPGAPTQTHFARSLAMLDPGTALVNDGLDDIGASGVCNVFGRDAHGTPDPSDDTWSLATTLDAPDFEYQQGLLAGSLAADGDLVASFGGKLLPGSPFPADDYVFIFERDSQGTADPFDDTWSQPAQIPGPVGGTEMLGFGWTLALSGQRLLLTLPYWTGGPPHFGGRAATYLRVGGAWTLEHELAAPDEAVLDGFGFLSLALQGDTALIGASGAPAQGQSLPVEGWTYVVDLAAAPAWQPLDVVDVHDKTPDLAGWGSPTGSAPIALRVYNGWEVGAPVALVMGAQRIDAPVKGQVLAPSPDLVLGLVIGPDGDVELAGRWPTRLPPGTTLWLQAWTDLSFGGWTAGTGISVTQP